MVSIKKKICNRLGINKFSGLQRNENLIALYDTSVGSLNVGDEIINSSSQLILSEIFKTKQFVKATTHDGMSSTCITHFNNASHRILCGSNIFSGRMFISNQWNIGPSEVIRLNKLLTLGVGWNDYENKTSSYSKWFYNQLLDKDGLHSVRDEYTKSKLNELGFDNVINTSCATMWKLTEEHCNKIKKEKSDSVVFTLTDYRTDKENDEKLINILCKNYKKIYLWLQGSNDLKYFLSLNVPHNMVSIVPPQLHAYDKLLESGNIDFVGTRLHAGIRALQYSNRTIIIGIDNRALEKKKDFNISVIKRNDIVSLLEDEINKKLQMEIIIPTDRINEWKSQFI